MPPLALRLLFLAFLAAFLAIIVVADRGQGFWGFLERVPAGDKLGHVGLVGTLTLLLNLVLNGRPAPACFRRFALGSVIVALGMTLEELSQLCFPSRSPDPADWIANLAGVALGAWLARRLGRMTPKAA